MKLAIIFTWGQKAMFTYDSETARVWPCSLPFHVNLGIHLSVSASKEAGMSMGLHWTSGSIRSTAIKDRGFLVRWHKGFSFYLDPCHLCEYTLQCSIQPFSVFVQLTWISLLCSYKYVWMYGCEHWLMLGNLGVVIHQVFNPRQDNWLPWPSVSSSIKWAP